MQHQFWKTKKTVQRKLGSKEDEHIISSDAELDAKIEVFKSISDTSTDLCKIIDQYQERLCVLSQEECVFGRFLKEVGKRSKTTGLSILNTGKAVSYSGQQRMCVRMPLLRLQHEVDVFRVRAVRDTLNTIQCMEKERTEYRAALSWMKFASSELDPDTGKGLEKFRTAQSHVRVAKQNFDGLSMDSIQKIDLLAAARCNMYSHALVSYMTELKQFAQKTASTFEAISKTLIQKPKYDFCVLKDLTQDEGNAMTKIKTIETVDKDQTLFFAEEYVDVQKKKEKQLENSPDVRDDEQILIELANYEEEDTVNTTHGNLRVTNNIWSKAFAYDPNIDKNTMAFTTINQNHQNKEINSSKDEKSHQSTKSVKSNRWMELFADLDPLAHPEAFDLKLNCGRTNFQQT